MRLKSDRSRAVRQLRQCKHWRHARSHDLHVPRRQKGPRDARQRPQRDQRQRGRSDLGASAPKQTSCAIPAPARPPAARPACRPSAARAHRDRAAFRPPTGVRCAAQRMSAASAEWRSPRRLACGSDARRARSAAAFRATPPTGRSAASVLASVKGEARQGAPAAPPLTFAVRAGGAETGRDGRMAVPGPNNRMARKMRGTVIGSARREAKAA